MGFYEYRQNNSGGEFHINNDLAVHVFIEADSPSEANSKAEDIGIYFDGVRQGDDCSCCGDRWHDTEDDEGEDTVNISRLVKTYRIHYKDGSIKRSEE